MKQWIDGFVDDTSLFVNLSIDSVDKNDISLLTTKLKEDMIIWKNLLEASGGKLELSKCFYYILSWKFDEEGNGKLMIITEQRQYVNEIQIQENDSDLSVLIKQRDVDDSHKTLGCFKTITGNEQDEIQTLKRKSDKYGLAVKKAKFQRKQAGMCYNTIYIPSIKYGLPATSLDIEDIDYIQRFAVDKFVSAIGYDHIISRAILFGPEEFGGIGLKHLFTEMMGMKLDSVISHVRANS